MIVYLVTNKVNNKVYVGQTVQTLGKRKTQHLRDSRGGCALPFHGAIRKHGVGNFTWEVLCTANDIGALNILEVYFIAKYGALDKKKGYNLMAGGKNSRHSAEARKRISIAKKGKLHSAEARERMSAAKKGKIHSAETRTKMSIARKGRRNHSFDPKIYTFFHPEHGIIGETKSGLMEKFSLQHGNLSKVISGKRPSHKSWRMAAAC